MVRWIIQVARSIFYDALLIPTNLGDTIQEAIDNLYLLQQGTATPSPSFDRSGSITANTWLYRVGNVPSNKTGVPVVLTLPVITKIQVGTEDIATYTLRIYEHEGNEVNLTLLHTVTVSATRTHGESVSIAITQGRQLAVKLQTGSCRNIGVDLVLRGQVT